MGRGGGGVGLGVRLDVNEELKFWGKFTKTIGGGGSGWGGQGRCEQRSEVFVKIKKKKIFWRGGEGGSGRGMFGGSQGGCKQRIEVFVKIKKNGWGRFGGGRGFVLGGGGARLDVNKELNFL